MRQVIVRVVWLIAVAVAWTALFAGALLGYVYARVHLGWPILAVHPALWLAALFGLGVAVAASVGVLAWGTRGRLLGMSGRSRSAAGRGFAVERSPTTGEP